MGRPSTDSPEFREQAVELVRATGKTVAEVTRLAFIDREQAPSGEHARTGRGPGAALQHLGRVPTPP